MPTPVGSHIRWAAAPLASAGQPRCHSTGLSTAPPTSSQFVSCRRPVSCPASSLHACMCQASLCTAPVHPPTPLRALLAGLPMTARWRRSARASASSCAACRSRPAPTPTLTTERAGRAVGNRDWQRRAGLPSAEAALGELSGTRPC
jgi:hypothetical protein